MVINGVAYVISCLPFIIISLCTIVSPLLRTRVIFEIQMVHYLVTTLQLSNSVFPSIFYKRVGETNVLIASQLKTGRASNGVKVSTQTG